MGSSRLPGKVLHDICGKPLLGHLLDRLLLCNALNGIVVATSVQPENDLIESYCRNRGIPCYRGSEDDVLDRMVGALRSQHADVGVQVFGDGPLIDPRIVDDCVDRFRQADGSYDFVGNDLGTTYPPGMEVEVFSVAALLDSHERALDPAVREHSTLFIRQNPGRYRLLNVEAPDHLRRPELEIEVDMAEDLEVVEAILRHFHPRNDMSLAEIIAFLDDRPEIASVNRDIPRRWKTHRDTLGSG